MPKVKTVKSSGTVKRSRPAATPDARENQLIAKAVALAERQLDEGTASSQVITHYLKLGTKKAQMEIEKLKHENELLKAKTEQIQSMKRVEELYVNALAAMKSYSGSGEPDD